MEQTTNMEIQCFEEVFPMQWYDGYQLWWMYNCIITQALGRQALSLHLLAVPLWLSLNTSAYAVWLTWVGDSGGEQGPSWLVFSWRTRHCSRNPPYLVLTEMHHIVAVQLLLAPPSSWNLSSTRTTQWKNILKWLLIWFLSSYFLMHKLRGCLPFFSRHT